MNGNLVFDAFAVNMRSGGSERAAMVVGGRQTDALDRALSELMRCAQTGDRAAYTTLLRDCQPLIRRAARRAGVVGDRVEDVVQDTLLTMHNARQTYDPTRSFSAWLSVIAQRRAIDLMRRSGRADRREIYAPLAYEAHPDDGPDASRRLEDAGRATMLRSAIAGLSPNQRDAVERLALREQSLAEASAETGKTVGSLKVNLHRALKALRGRLGGQAESGRDDAGEGPHV